MDKLSAATALLNWFDTKIAEHKQRLDEQLIEVFANISKDFATLHNGIRRIVSEDVNTILQEGAAMNQAPMSGYGSAPAAAAAAAAGPGVGAPDWRGPVPAAGQTQQQPQGQGAGPIDPQQQQQQVPSAAGDLDIVRLINERPAELQSFLATHLQGGAAGAAQQPAMMQPQQLQQQQQQQQQPNVQQMLSLIQAAQQQQQQQQQVGGQQGLPGQQPGNPQALQQMLMQLQQQQQQQLQQQQPGAMAPGAQPGVAGQGMNQQQFPNGPGVVQNGASFNQQGLYLDGPGRPMGMGTQGTGPMQQGAPGPRMRLNDGPDRPGRGRGGRSRSRSPLGRRRSRSPPRGRPGPRSPPGGPGRHVPMGRVGGPGPGPGPGPHGGNFIGSLAPPARQLVENLIQSFPGVFKPVDFDEDLVNYLNENLQAALVLFRDILEGRNTFAQRSNIRKMAAWIISEIKAIRRQRM